MKQNYLGTYGVLKDIPNKLTYIYLEDLEKSNENLGVTILKCIEEKKEYIEEFAVKNIEKQEKIEDKIAILIELNEEFKSSKFWKDIVYQKASKLFENLCLEVTLKNIAEKDLMEAYSFTQLLSYLGSFAGQALGVWLLNISQQNFAIVALINALCFLLSSSTLYLIRKKLTHDAVIVKTEKTPFKTQMKSLYSNVQMIFEHEKVGNFILVLLQVLLLNALGGSIMALYNLYLLDHPFWGLDLSQSILVIQSCLVIGIIAASAFPNDYFAKLPLTKLMVWGSLFIFILGLCNLLQAPALLGIIALSFLMYISGKINPKLNSMLLSKLPADVLAQTSNFLTMIFTFSIPLGSMIFTSLALWNMEIAWMVFSIIGGICLLLSVKNR